MLRSAPHVTRVLRVVAWCVLFCAPWSVCHAGLMHFCDKSLEFSAEQKDKLYRFADIIKTELEHSGQSIAIVARSGTDLSRFNVRYSHAGFSLKANQNTPWSVRQLYYDCAESKPKIFDQGIAGFLMGFDSDNIGYVSIIFLPEDKAAELEQHALNDRQAVQLLGTVYSANAYPYSVLYQNCNQWVAELIATSWGHLNDDQPRIQAQQWLKQKAYEPSVFNANGLMWLEPFAPWLHNDDHPSNDIDQQMYQVSMPASIEKFVHTVAPSATRMELCYTRQHVVIHKGWDAMAEGCEPRGEDIVMRLQ